MASGRFISYVRVSTARQGASGLGLAAQQDAVRAHLNGGDCVLLREFVEVESGKNDRRPQLTAAIAECRLTGSTLLIAKLDRLSRNAAFLMRLRDEGTKFIAVDMPDANWLTVGILALVAQNEREAISARTKAALAVTKARGKVLGGYKGGPMVDGTLGVKARQAKAMAFREGVLPVLTEMRDRGLSLRECVAELETRGVQTPRCKGWTAGLVSRLLKADEEATAEQI